MPTLLKMMSKIVFLLFIFISRAEKCFSRVPDSERFSSSIVASDTEMLFGLPTPQSQHTKDEITRSYIDRDPIYFDDDEFANCDLISGLEPSGFKHSQIHLMG